MKIKDAKRKIALDIKLKRFETPTPRKVDLREMLKQAVENTKAK